MSVQPTHNLSLADLGRRSFLHPFTALAEHLARRDRAAANVRTDGIGQG
jgi:hypothetical protein